MHTKVKKGMYFLLIQWMYSLIDFVIFKLFSKKKILLYDINDLKLCLVSLKAALSCVKRTQRRVSRGHNVMCQEDTMSCVKRTQHSVYRTQRVSRWHNIVCQEDTTLCVKRTQIHVSRGYNVVCEEDTTPFVKRTQRRMSRGHNAVCQDDTTLCVKMTQHCMSRWHNTVCQGDTMPCVKSTQHRVSHSTWLHPTEADCNMLFPLDFLGWIDSTVGRFMRSIVRDDMCWQEHNLVKCHGRDAGSVHLIERVASTASALKQDKLQRFRGCSQWSGFISVPQRMFSRWEKLMNLVNLAYWGMPQWIVTVASQIIGFCIEAINETEEHHGER